MRYYLGQLQAHHRPTDLDRHILVREDGEYCWFKFTPSMCLPDNVKLYSNLNNNSKGLPDWVFTGASDYVLRISDSVEQDYPELLI